MVLFGVILAVAIDIDNGRQLLVDDFLIAETNGIVRHWNRPLKVGPRWGRDGAGRDGRDGVWYAEQNSAELNE